MTVPGPQVEGRRIEGRGTDEQTWQRWPGWGRMPQAGLDDLVPAGARLVVVAPHPDDEVLGAGGLLATAADAGRPVLVVAVTGGGASHPGSLRWPEPTLLAQRRTEREEALHELGVDASAVLELGIADGTVTAHLHDLTERLGACVQPGDVVVAPWELDGHPDHEAVAHAVSAVSLANGCSALQMPIWGWHWVRPDSGDFPERRAVGLGLAPTMARRKRAAAARFVSQLTDDPSTGAAPILPSWALDRLLRDREVFFR